MQSTEKHFKQQPQDFLQRRQCLQTESIGIKTFVEEFGEAETERILPEFVLGREGHLGAEGELDARHDLAWPELLNVDLRRTDEQGGRLEALDVGIRHLKEALLCLTTMRRNVRGVQSTFNHL